MSAVLFSIVAVLGVLVLASSILAMRLNGARPALARRLAGPPQVSVGHLLDDGAPRGRALRVQGRIRCRDPLLAEDGERLVAFHRDIEVRAGGRWWTIERMRETRSFELWDHDGSLAIDPARAVEPLVTIPTVWRGAPSHLHEPHASAIARLSERHGAASEARSTTRTINVTDRLLVLATPVDDGDRVALEPPEGGGFVISALELDDAMRLLGGRNRRVAAAAVIGLAAGVVLAAVGSVGAVVTALLAG